MLHVQARFGKKPDILPHGNMDGIIPTDSRRRNSKTLSPHMAADIERAQRFRERARTVTAGRPKFKVSRKSRSFKSELSFHTLENHQFGDKVTFRRISEDRTSSFSAYSITDIESRGGPLENSSGGLIDEEMSVNSYDPNYMLNSMNQVKEEDEVSLTIRNAQTN